MPNLEIGAYRVGALRRDDVDVTRFLIVEPVPGYDGPAAAGGWLYFSDEPPELGYATESMVVGRLPTGMFADIYHIVQTERPVYLTWEQEQEGNRLVSCGVTTAEEPPGEGLRDHSA